MNPPVSPTAILAVLLLEALFGIGFNRLVAWAHEHEVWHSWLSVIMGVAISLAIPTAWWWNVPLAFWQAMLLTLGCLAVSGLPMVVGSQWRTAVGHQRREWPNAARQARDEAVMDLRMLAAHVANKAKSDAQVVDALHVVIGSLTSIK